MKKVTICADDYGQNAFISQAILTLVKKNRLSATSCMTTSLLWSEHAEWLKPVADSIDIGLHFNLTEGNPLSEALKKQHGFLPLSKLICKAYCHTLNDSAIEAELNAQLDAFRLAMGRLPDFLDGHQHIHQLPVIRNVLLKVYEERLRQTNCYLRCVYDAKWYVHRQSMKKWMIQFLGAHTFKKQVIKHQIPHNSSFSGIYSFDYSTHYSHIFPRFLTESCDKGLIMCHPGLLYSSKTDVIAKARYDEFSYLESDAFVLDCFNAGVVLGRLPRTVSI